MAIDLEEELETALGGYAVRIVSQHRGPEADQLRRRAFGPFRSRRRAEAFLERLLLTHDVIIGVVDVPRKFKPTPLARFRAMSAFLEGVEEAFTHLFGWKG